MLTAAFYWDQNDETRAWSKRFFDKTNKEPTMVQAGVYGAIMHYLEGDQGRRQTDRRPKVDGQDAANCRSTTS